MMRHLATMGAALVLAACVGGAGTRPASNPGPAAGVIAGPSVTTTALPAPKGAAATLQPQAPAQPPAQPPAQLQPAQLQPAQPQPAAPYVGKASYSDGAQCLREGGQWAEVGRGAMACVKPTRDAGKSCDAKGDCQGECLARSRSCSPIAPLFGCNDILTEGGLQVTQCID